MKRDIILDNYQNPRNKGLTNNDRYLKSDMNNESCIDHVIVEALIEDNIIKDIKFDGEACAICTSATSVMISTLIGKSVSDAKEILKNYEYMIDEKDYNEELLEEASIYSDIAKQPNRKKCALLAWWGIKKVIGDDNEKI